MRKMKSIYLMFSPTVFTPRESDEYQMAILKPATIITGCISTPENGEFVKHVDIVPTVRYKEDSLTR